MCHCMTSIPTPHQEGCFYFFLLNSHKNSNKMRSHEQMMRFYKKKKCTNYDILHICRKSLSDLCYINISLHWVLCVGFPLANIFYNKTFDKYLSFCLNSSVFIFLSLFLFGMLENLEIGEYANTLFYFVFLFCFFYFFFPEVLYERVGVSIMLHGLKLVLDKVLTYSLVLFEQGVTY